MRLPILCATTLLASACVSVPNIEGCTPAGALEAGGDCAMTNTGHKRQVTAQQLIEMLEPKVEWDPVKQEWKTIRAGGVIVSADDYKRMKNAQELACREIGNRCTYDKSPPEWAPKP